MSTEPASLIPLMKGVCLILSSVVWVSLLYFQASHVALIGDHKQLPPVITSPEAQAQGFGVSLFERLSDEGGEFNQPNL